MKTMTTTNEITPIIEHIQALQLELKKIEADIKQHKALLQNDYMQDIDKILSPEGMTLAQMVSQTRESFQAAELKKLEPDTYIKYVKTIEISFLKVS